MKSKFKVFAKGSLIKIIERIVDLAIVFGAILVYAIFSIYLDTGEVPNIFQKLIETLNGAMSYALYMTIIFFLFRIYSPSVFERNYLSVMKQLFLSLLLGNFLLVLITFFVGNNMLFSAEGVVGVVFVQLVIFSIIKFFTSKYLSGLVRSNSIIIGTRAEANDLAIDFFDDNEHNKILRRIIYEIDGELPNNVIEYMAEADDIYITPGLVDKNKHMVVQYAIAHLSKDVHLVPVTYEISLIGAKDETIDDTLVLHIPMMRMTTEQRIIKRSFDFLVSGIALILLLPFFIIIGLLIKLEDKGDIFYRQKRYKRSNELFTVYKFRTMYMKQAEHLINKRATKADPRITKIGRFLRATRIDELPQLINVFKGEMSLVGPRPLIQDEVDQAIKEIPEFYYRMNVKPGLTGLAQVKGKYDTKEKEKIRYDLLYVKKANFWFDLKILILTIKTVFTVGSITQEKDRTIHQILEQRNIYFDESEHCITIPKQR